MTRYRTIVVDPPWDHSDGTGVYLGSAYAPDPERSPKYRLRTQVGPTRATHVPYPVMTVAEIGALPISALAGRNAHLYLWTTQRYLHASFDLIAEWGFAVSATLIWCKAPKGFMGGAYRSSTEFVQFARRGGLSHKSQAPSRWFQWPRGAHSAKPDAFLDLVETVSPGPYLELFARRQRLGWDTWGNEALEHVEVGSGCGSPNAVGSVEGSTA